MTQRSHSFVAPAVVVAALVAAALAPAAARAYDTNAKSTKAEGSTKPKPASAAASATTATTKVSAVGLVYAVPSTWSATPITSSMRKAQYKLPAAKSGVEDGELVMFHFGVGQGGDVASNIDRWINQMTPEGGAQSSSKGPAEPFMVGDFKVTTVDADGTYASGMPGSGASQPKPGWRLLGAVVEGKGGPWFFKAVGPKETIVAAEKEFHAMLKTVKSGG
ncbi:MAG: hypothetical protein ACKVU1_12550 [bacterium]